MKILLILYASIFFFSSPDEDLEQYRSLYVQSAKSKKAAQTLWKLLEKQDRHAPAIVTGYKGAARMMQAKYAFSPISKYTHFKNGRELIEQALKKEPKNIEVRYLRYTIQTNLPSFLGYKDQIRGDREFLIDQLKTITDQKLKHNIQQYIKQQGKYVQADE